MASQKEKKNQKMVEEFRPWSNLPTELLEQILSRLPLSYHPYFASACKSWNQISSPVYPADCSPLLVHYKKWGDGICRYYHPSSNKTFIVDCPLDLDISGTKFYFSRHGWLLLYREHIVILFNPITGISHEFPGIPHRYNFHCIAFSGSPSNNDCIIFAIESMIPEYANISIYDGERWTTDIEFANKLSFILAQHSSPVVSGGLFYCLGRKGNLGVYDPSKHTWTVLAKPKQINFSYEESYLVESDGELLAVLFWKRKPTIRVLRLNRVEMVWEKVESLGAQSLFAGSEMSLLTTTTSMRRMENKVYLPRLHGVPEIIEAEVRCSEGRMFFIPKTRSERASEGSICYSYSLKTGEQTNYFGSRELVYSVWFEPRL